MRRTETKRGTKRQKNGEDDDEDEEEKEQKGEEDDGNQMSLVWLVMVMCNLVKYDGMWVCVS